MCRVGNAEATANVKIKAKAKAKARIGRRWNRNSPTKLAIDMWYYLDRLGLERMMEEDENTEEFLDALCNVE